MSAEIRIIPAKKYVRLHYQPCHTLDNLCKTFKAESLKGLDGNKDVAPNMFVEGLMYSPDSAVIMSGTLTDEAEPGKVRPKFSK